MWSSNQRGVLVSPWTPNPAWVPGCQAPITPPSGPLTTAIEPRSATAIAGTTVPPPWVCAAATTRAAFSVARYTDHTSVTGDPGIVGMQPAIRTSS